MKYKAVITGDIVHSRMVNDMQLLLSILKDTVDEIGGWFRTQIPIEIYRGDSFQMVIDKPEDAIKIAILIRARLKSQTFHSSEKEINLSLDKLWDARISIGVGNVHLPATRIVESTGEAFELSGIQLDNMNKSTDRIRLISSWENLNRQFRVITKLGDSIISKWTLNSAEAAYRYLLYNETQKQIAGNLNISQPAVHKRLNTANIEAIESMLNYLAEIIKNKRNGI